MKWYNAEFFNESEKDAVRKFLRENGIYHEISGCGSGWHFEIKATLDQVEQINNFIDTL